MLKIAEILYGLEIHERHDINVWHDDVTYYEISEHGEVVGKFLP